MKQLEQEIKALIVETLLLEDVRPEEIDSEAALFGTGLGLDSVDGLELALALSKRFGVTIKADDERARRVFGSVASLAAFIAAQRAAAPRGSA